jgi:hypothetical protein
MVSHFDPELRQRAEVFCSRELSGMDVDPERAEHLREALERELARVYERFFAPERDVLWRLLCHGRQQEKRLHELESERDALSLTVTRQQETITALEEQLSLARRSSRP